MSTPDRTKTDRAGAPRPSFRRRLLMTVGPAVAGALAVLALIAWGAVSYNVHRTALETLAGEVNEMRADARLEGGLDVSGYAWAEAHHRLAVERVDPIFVQVFDKDRQLVRQSENIDALPDAYPDRLLPVRAAPEVWPTLQTFSVEGEPFYYETRPLRDASGTTLGYVQVARAVPAHRAFLGQFGAAVAGLWVLLTVGLLGLVGWAAGRVLRPLRSITRVAQSVTSSDLDTRVDVPDEADQETATLGRTFNALLDRIEAHVHALRAFTANAAHELQTPLTVLQGHVEIALRRERDAASYRDTLRLLDEKLGSLVRTLRALLTLTRLDRDGQLEREPINLADIARDEVEAFRERAEQKGIGLSVEANGAAWAYGQPDLLREAVRNLADNAVKYTGDGAVTVSVDPAAEGTVQLTCRDTGMGMSEAEVEQITERFYRGDGASQTAEGSGLGLALVQRIVEEHEGTLEVASVPEEGTRFTIKLPAAPNPTSDSLS